jgi:hypothetical protein
MLTRRIKTIGSIGKINEYITNPITLELLKEVDENEICPITNFYNKNANEIISLSTKSKLSRNYNFNLNYKCNKLSKEEIKQNMLLPNLILSEDNILNMCNINTIEQLIDYINNEIDNKSFDFLNRLVNIWIRIDFDIIKKNNKILFDIYIILFNKFFPKIIIKKEYHDKINKYILNWFNNIKIDDFNLNLARDLKLYIKKISK